ncbi:hypothetical protein AWY89_10740 [Pasteurella multocida subsp. multocida]|nr:hypothetical protein AWY89_10740 [Pasteurella multocida subsp. multocida]
MTQTETTSDSLAKFLLPVPSTLRSAGLKVLVLEGGMLPPGDMTMPLNWKLRLPPGHCGLLLHLSQQAKKGVTALAVVIDLDIFGGSQWGSHSRSLRCLVHCARNIEAEKEC